MKQLRATDVIAATEALHIATEALLVIQHGDGDGDECRRVAGHAMVDINAKLVKVGSG